MLTLKYSSFYVLDWYSVASNDERCGNIKKANMYINDHYYACKTFEDAEIKMENVVYKNIINKHKIDLIIGSDLSNQLGNLNYAIRNTKTSFLGIYNACSSFNEGVIIAGNFVNNVDKILVMVSSHLMVSERQFRFPNEYGSIKKKYTTNTITASIGVVLSNIKTNVKIVSSTIGDIVDYDIKDAANMGAIMAPAAASAINAHLTNTNKSINDYDYILTGDLGFLGVTLLKSVLKDDYGIISDNIIDAGSIIYKEKQKKGMGGSGPTCLPFAFFNKFINANETKRVLLVSTGALHNPTLVNQGKSIPAISHVIEMEVNNGI